MVLQKDCCLVTNSCLTLCDPMDCSLPDSSVHGIFQARLLERVASSFFRGSSQLRDQTHISCRWILYHWTARQAPHKWLLRRKYSTLWEISITMTLSRRWHGGPSWGTESPLVSHPGAVGGALGQRGDSCSTGSRHSSVKQSRVGLSNSSCLWPVTGYSQHFH